MTSHPHPAPHRNPANPWRLVVSDLDGTLLDEQGLIPPANRTAIEQLRRLGVGFTIASGRHEHMARKVARDLNVDLPIIACNGAIVSEYQTGQIIRQDSLPSSAAVAVIEGLLRQSIDFVCYSANEVYYWRDSGRSDIVRNFNALADTQACDRICMIRIGNDPSGQMQGVDLVKIVISIPDRPIQKIVEQLISDQPGLCSVLSQDGVLELNAAGTSKGAALRWLADSLGIKSSEVIAFGDHDNDETMLAVAGLGIAMANATPAAFAASQLMTHGHNQSGVASAIRQLFGQETDPAKT